MEFERLVELMDDETLEEMMFLRAFGGRRREELSYLPFKVNLELIDEDEFKKMFRFERRDIPRLCDALGLPQVVDCGANFSVPAKEGLLILLRRLAYPNRLSDLSAIFARSVPALSMIASVMTKLVIERKGHRLNLMSLEWINLQRLQLYANAAVRRGAPLKNCWGYIDGTARAICRPTRDQQEYFSGHKRHHCVKFQSVATPDGLIVSLSGAYPGRRHDAGILTDSHLYGDLEQKVAPFVLYGDPAYPVRDLLIAPFPTTNLTPGRALFNRRMSTVRQAVEWSFGRVVSLFAFVDFKKNQKLLLQDVEQMYKVAVLLTNAHSCLYSNQTAQFFRVQPPDLEVYLG